MKILYITAGAAGMYCGSCLRDNALAAALLAEGHDVTLMPLYTPTLTDEENVSSERVFFGGISVYLQQHSALFRKTPWLLDRLWDSRLALKAAARSSIQVDPRALGELTVSTLKGEDGNQRKEFRKLLRWLQSAPPPDIINLPNSLLISLAGPIKKALGRPVCCTLQGENLFLDSLREPYRSQSLDLIRANVQHVDGFIAVSQSTAATMGEWLGIPEDRMHVVPLGISLKDYPRRERPRSEVFRVGFFARVAPEKGLHVLCDAYRQMRQRPDAPPMRLEAAGYLAPEHRPYLHGIEEQMRAWGLGHEFHYHGTLERREKLEFLHSLDVLSVPATFEEQKGLPVIEAMAAGVPVVQPRRGTFTEVVEKTGGGLLVEPDDPDALADAILTIAKDPALAYELGHSGRAGVERHHSAARMAESALEVYGKIMAQANGQPAGAISG